MGIYDRDYYRDDDGGRWLERIGSSATGTLITAMIGLFVLQIFSKPAALLPDWLARWGDFYPPALWQGQLWRVLTNNYLHDSREFFGFVFKMLVLYFLGRELESTMGREEFFWFFVAAGLYASVCKVLFAAVGFGAEVHTLGSGPAVLAVLCLYASRDPTTPLHLFFFLPVPVWILSAVAVGLNAFFVAGGGAELATGAAANLCAAGFARLYWLFNWRVTPGWQFSLPQLGRSRPRLTVYQGPGEERQVAPARAPARTADAPATSGVPEQLEADLDRVLDKVAREGKSSLTAAETEILLRASEIFKRRRGR